MNAHNFPGAKAACSRDPAGKADGGLLIAKGSPVTPSIPLADAHLIEQVFEHYSAAVLLFDQEHKLMVMNPAAEDLLELSARQARRQPLRTLFPMPNPFAALVDKALRGHQALGERSLDLFLSDGREIQVDCVVTPSGEPDGGTGFLLELSDVTQAMRVTREEQLLAQNESARSVLRGLAHEIRNPLGGLRGAAQLMAREVDDPALSEYCQIIISEADRLQALLERMLGPRQLPRRAAVNIHEVTERVRALVQVEAPSGVVVERDYDPSIPELQGDHDMLLQALLNIVRNAVQALTEHGKVLIRTRVLRQARVGARRYRLVACIDVVDDGPGIPEALKSHLFYPMVTGRPDGTGLGLSIAQSLIAHHGGLIECKSQPGNTEFSTFLPIEP